LQADLEISNPHHPREAGSVTPMMDRRKDLFELKVHLDQEGLIV
jgi:hypothetical protein